MIRALLTFFVGGLIWIALARRAYPHAMSFDSLWEAIWLLFRIFLAADVFRRVLLAGFVIWAAYQLAAIYLDDIFELRDVAVAARFIRQAAFTASYDLMEIKDGWVNPDHRRSPVFLIGGPGKVRVFLENAALFEKVDGTPRIVSPNARRGTEVGILSDSTTINPNLSTKSGRFPWFRRSKAAGQSQPHPGDKVVELTGFERLRSVIDLRDQVENGIDISERTRDGILVKARNVKMVFSVLRGSAETNLQRPYPFDEGAIKKLVYKQPAEGIWSKTMVNLIRRELRNFISQHTLNEFLAAINAPEIESLARESEKIHQEGARLAGVSPEIDEEPPDLPNFKSRRELTDQFYDLTSRFTNMAQINGVQLRWIGVGTWETKDEIIPTRHQEAWRISLTNFVRGSDAALEQLRREAQIDELAATVREIPLVIFKDMTAKNETKDQIVKQMVNAYRSKLRAALDLYKREKMLDQGEIRRLQRVLEFMARVLYNWLGDAQSEG